MLKIQRYYNLLRSVQKLWNPPGHFYSPIPVGADIVFFNTYQELLMPEIFRRDHAALPEKRWRQHLAEESAMNVPDLPTRPPGKDGWPWIVEFVLRHLRRALSEEVYE